MKHVNKKFISLLLALTLVMGTFAVGNIADAEGGVAKVERCTIQAAIVEVDGVEYKMEGGLKPFVVPVDTDWYTFLSNMYLTGFEVIKNDACTNWDSSHLKGYIIVDGEEYSLLYNGAGNHNFSWRFEDTVLDQDYYDLKFQFCYGVTEETPTALNVRVAKGYQIAYDLQGGTFGESTLDGYVSWLENTLPIPEKEGYDFIGWTGEGLDSPTVNVVLPEGTEGDKSYVANWTEKSVEIPPVKEPGDTLPVVGEKLQDSVKKANFKVTVSKENAVEVEYVAPVKKNAKKVTIPETVTLSDGTKAKVTSIAANAFKGNKKLTTVVIGKNIKKIGKKAFYNCKNLKKITINSTSLTKKSIGAKAFKNTSNKAVVKVVKKKLKTYKKILIAKGISKKAKMKAK